MQRSIYIRPVGIFPNAHGKASGEDAAGEIWGGFRSPAGRWRSRRSKFSSAAGAARIGARSVSAISSSATGGGIRSAASDLLEAIRAPRGASCGLSLDRTAHHGHRQRNA